MHKKIKSSVLENGMPSDRYAIKDERAMLHKIMTLIHGTFRFS